MIIKFNPVLFLEQDEETHTLLNKVILEVLNDRYIWDTSNIIEVCTDLESVVEDTPEAFFEKFLSLNFSKEFVSQNDKKNLLNQLFINLEQEAYLTKEHQFYLSSLTIGPYENEVPLANAFKIISLPSKIVLENGTNDWKFIKGVSEKYIKNKKRKNLYKLLNKAINNFWIEPENAGGIGGIELSIETLISGKYKDIEKHKICTIFDSDKSNTTQLNSVQKNLISYLKKTEVSSDDINSISYEQNDRLIWHVLYKREIENYIPKSILINELNNLPQNIINELNDMPQDKLDFLKYSEYLEKVKNIDVKSDFPSIFLKDFDRNQLEDICKHHQVKIETYNNNLEDVSEIEMILIKLLKLL